jgi:hypothetical protein
MYSPPAAGGNLPFVNNNAVVFYRNLKRLKLDVAQHPRQSAVDGRMPRGIGVARLFDAPVAWSRQQQMLGFAH